MSNFIYETDLTQHLLEKPRFCLFTYDFKPALTKPTLVSTSDSSPAMWRILINEWFQFVIAHTLTWTLLFLDVKLLENQAFVEGVQEQVNAALLEYTLSAYPQFQEKFSQLLVRLPELRSLSTQAEDYLCYMHVSGEVPCNNLLIEMLHAKRACVWGAWAGRSATMYYLSRWECVDGKERVTGSPGSPLWHFLFWVGWKKSSWKFGIIKLRVLTASLEILNINVFMSCRAALTWPSTYKLDFLTCFQASKVRPAYKVTFYLF